MYSDKVMDHFKNPRNVGEIENASGVGTVGNAKCGDIMRIYLDIDENQVIRDAKFKTFGCGAAVATSSMATELIIGKTVEEAMIRPAIGMKCAFGENPKRCYKDKNNWSLWRFFNKKHYLCKTIKKALQATTLQS